MGRKLSSSNGTYISCPYDQKDDAKYLGALWDPTRKQWFVPVELDLQPFAHWLDGGAPSGDAQYGATCDKTGTRLTVGGGWWHKRRTEDCVGIVQTLTGLNDLCDDEYQNLSPAQRGWFVEIARADDLVPAVPQWIKDEYTDAETGEQIHHGISCDLSQMEPIRGKRWKKNGKNYDLCDTEYRRLRPKQQAKFQLVKKSPGEIEHAESYLNVYKHGHQYMNQRTGRWAYCWHCGGHLVAIGHARFNGRDHVDWMWREYHKKCWRELQL